HEACQHDPAVRRAQQRRQRPGAAAAALVERLQPREEKPGGGDAGEEPCDDGGAVAAAGCRGNARRARAESGQREPEAENRAAGELRQQVRVRDVEEGDVDQSQPAQPERAEHRRQEGAEHHLQHGEAAEQELPGELARAAESRAFQREAEPHADREGGQQVGHRQDPLIAGAAAYAAANAVSMKPQLPTLSSAPPVSAWPLVQPRASTAPSPMTAPPPNAIASRERTLTPLPRSTSPARPRPPRPPPPAPGGRPGSPADRKPPRNTPRISNSSQSRQGPSGEFR